EESGEAEVLDGAAGGVVARLHPLPCEVDDVSLGPGDRKAGRFYDAPIRGVNGRRAKVRDRLNIPDKQGTLGEAPIGFDLIVVGSGIAGLSAAIEAAEGGLRVLVVTKDAENDGASDRAQGGVAVALGEDDAIELHERDTVAAGDGLCDAAAVHTLVSEGPRRVADLIAWGTRFDRDGSGLSRAREGAHSASRVLHASGDSTGREIVRALLAKAASHPSITMRTGLFSARIVVDRGRCAGLELL